jgi:Transglycosylase-like domain/LysM domain
MHKYLPRRAARLGATLALTGGMVISALALPAAATGGSYTVKSGDTLGSIARMHGLGSWNGLYQANRDSIKNPNLIFPGQKLTLASGGGSQAPTVERSSGTPQQSATSSSHRNSQPAPQASSVPAGGTVWDRLAQCESGGNWSINTGNGFYGGLQFTQSSWRAAGGSGSPQNASRAEQIRVAERLQQMQGWGAWPTCSAKLGLR